MQHQVYPTPVSPVISRFTQIRDGWLGRPVVRKKKTKFSRRKKSIKQSAFAQKLARRGKKLLKLTLNGVIIVSFLATAFFFGPRVFFSIFPHQTEKIQAEELSGDFQLALDGEKVETRKQAAPTQRNFQPPYNENLPEGDWMVIPRIGVRSTLQPTEHYEEALETGLWLAPDFGKPGDKSLPMIVAGHRFGFKWWWENDYWKYHSFYLLPDLEVGDKIEVISGKRKYVYEIYAGEEGTEITDYQADLIVYTCKHLDSPIRIFRYAKLLPPEGDTLLGHL